MPSLTTHDEVFNEFELHADCIDRQCAEKASDVERYEVINNQRGPWRRGYL